MGGILPNDVLYEFVPCSCPRSGRNAARFHRGLGRLRPAAIPLVAFYALGVSFLVPLTDNKARSAAEQVATTGILVLCLAILFVMFALSAAIFRVLGRPGVEIVSRVF